MVPHGNLGCPPRGLRPSGLDHYSLLLSIHEASPRQPFPILQAQRTRWGFEERDGRLLFMDHLP